MKVLLLSPTDTKGGASKIAFGLARGLRAHGVEANLFVNSRFSDEPFVHEFPAYQTERFALAQKAIHRLGINALNLNSAFPKSLGRAFFESYDLVHLHDLPMGFNIVHLKWLSDRIPTAWTIHSMQPLTGNCIFSYECDRWKKHCGQCPQFGHWPLHWLHRDGSRLNLRIKRALYKRARLKTIGVSSWTTNRIKESVLKQTEPETILNPVDLSAFYPMDRAAVRRELGIADDRFAIMFSVGANVSDTRKGLDIILKALPSLDRSKVVLLPTGISGVPERLSALADYPGLAPVHLSSDEQLRRYYNAADVVWHPTRADTSSLVSLESLACGTPVIAARVGGVPEIVKHGVNGFLVDADDPEGLASATIELMNAPAKLAAFAEASVESVRSRGMADFIEEHLDLYQRSLRL